MKKTIIFVLSLLLTLLFVVSVCYAGTNDLQGGIEGTDITWSYDSDKKALSFEGSGVIGDYFYGEGSSKNRTPWEAVENEVETLIIGDGITGIGNYAFSACNNLMRIQISDTVINMESTCLPNMSNRSDYKGKIYCEAGSGAEAYAISNHYPYTTKDVKLLNGDSAGYDFVGYADGTAEILGCSLDKSDIKIPEVLGEFNVTSIGRKAFYNNDTIKYITIGVHIKSIGFEAFRDCDTLKQVNVEGDVNWELEVTGYLNCAPSELNGVFSYCDSLTNVILEEGVTSIPGGFTYACEAMDDIRIPSTVGEIGLGAIGYWKKNEGDMAPGDSSHVVYDNVVIKGYTGSIAEAYANELGGNTFFFTTGNLIEEYRFDVNQDKIVSARDALLVLKAAAKFRDLNYNQTVLSDVNLDNSITAEDALIILQSAAKIGVERKNEVLPGTNGDTLAMYDTDSNVLMLESYSKDMIITSTEEYLNYIASFSENIEIIKLHCDAMAIFGNNVFSSFNNLKEIHIYCEDITMDPDAFDNEKVSQIKLYGISGTEAEKYADGKAMNFEAINGSKSGVIEGTDITWDYNAETKQLVVDGSGIIPDYFNISTRPVFGLDIEDRTPWSLFEKEIESLIIGDGIEKIGCLAFAYCNSLKQIYIPTGVDCMSTRGYRILPDMYNTNDRKSRIYCEAGSSAEEYAIDRSFPYTTKKVEVLCGMENDYEYVGYVDGTADIVDYVGEATEIVIPETLGGYKVNTILRKAFCNNDYITSVEIGENIEAIGFEAFTSCDLLEYVSIKGNIEWELHEANYANCAPYDANGVFAFCKALKRIDLGNKLTKIPAGFTYGCASMSRITIPETVTEIGFTALGEWKKHVCTIPDAVGCSSYETSKDAVIEGYSGTAAEEFANRNGMKFEIIN